MAMDNPMVKELVIVGGGTAGWMTAAALVTVLRGQVSIRVVESDEIGIVGVGEATIPMIQRFNRVLGIDENEFLRQTQGTFKLGIEFVNWGKTGDRYMHGFGKIGQDLWTVNFDQYWQKMRRSGKADELAAYSITRMAAKSNKFMPARQDVENSPVNDIAHAYHFDASLYARYLRGIAESRGVRRTEGKVTRCITSQEDGSVTHLVMENGEQIGAELFIDCSGFRGLLTEQCLQTGYEDWSHWLPCDRALAVPCAPAPALLPYTRATAHRAGWQWRIPLQHRIGNGHVYCSQYVSDDEAAATLLANLDGEALAEPRMLRFQTGMRKLAWNKNVIAIGLSGGFLEPLESTSIHLIQSAIARLITFFPRRQMNQADVDEYNRQSRFEYERIRDFVILHYKVNQRTDADFWKMCSDMRVPETLEQKIALYRNNGRLLRIDNELFAEEAWLQVMEGQNLQPATYHPLADLLPDSETEQYLQSVKQVIANCVAAMPDHAAYIQQHCAAARS